MAIAWKSVSNITAGKRRFTYPVTIQEVGMASVDVHRLHRYQVPDKLIRRIHDFLEERNDNLVELLLQLGISSEQLLAK